MVCSTPRPFVTRATSPDSSLRRRAGEAGGGQRLAGPGIGARPPTLLLPRIRVGRVVDREGCVMHRVIAMGRVATGLLLDRKLLPVAVEQPRLLAQHVLVCSARFGAVFAIAEVRLATHDELRSSCRSFMRQIPFRKCAAAAPVVGTLRSVRG